MTTGAASSAPRASASAVWRAPIRKPMSAHRSAPVPMTMSWTTPMKTRAWMAVLMRSPTASGRLTEAELSTAPTTIATNRLTATTARKTSTGEGPAYGSPAAPRSTVWEPPSSTRPSDTNASPTAASSNAAPPGLDANPTPVVAAPMIVASQPVTKRAGARRPSREKRKRPAAGVPAVSGPGSINARRLGPRSGWQP